MPAVLRTRHLACLLALALALPSAAFAQGAGDDQYQDPFGDEPTAQAQNGQDDGLSEEPPGDGEDGDDGTGGSGSGGGTGGGTPAPATATPRSGLPTTGSDLTPLALVGAAFLLMGVGLRLRTIDPDAF
jgi:hypothetical protein